MTGVTTLAALQQHMDRDSEQMLRQQSAKIERRLSPAPYQFVRPAAKVGSPRFAFVAYPGKIRG